MTLNVSLKVTVRLLANVKMPRSVQQLPRKSVAQMEKLTRTNASLKLPRVKDRNEYELLETDRVVRMNLVLCTCGYFSIFAVVLGGGGK